MNLNSDLSNSIHDSDDFFLRQLAILFDRSSIGLNHISGDVMLEFGTNKIENLIVNKLVEFACPIRDLFGI